MASKRTRKEARKQVVYLLDDLFRRLSRALDVAQHALHKVKMHSPVTLTLRSIRGLHRGGVLLRCALPML